MKKLLLMVILLNTLSCRSQPTIKLAWDPSPSYGVTKYLFYRSIGESPFTVITNALPNSPYIVTVPTVLGEMNGFFATAVNIGSESAPSNLVYYYPTNVITPPITNPPPVVLNTPTNLTIQLINGRRFDLQWHSDPTLVTEVEQSIKAEPFSKIATVSAGTMHYTLQLDKKREYLFRVRSIKPPNASEYSNMAITR